MSEKFPSAPQHEEQVQPETLYAEDERRPAKKGLRKKMGGRVANMMVRIGERRAAKRAAKAGLEKGQELSESQKASIAQIERDFKLQQEGESAMNFMRDSKAVMEASAQEAGVDISNPYAHVSSELDHDSMSDLRTEKNNYLGDKRFRESNAAVAAANKPFSLKTDAEKAAYQIPQDAFAQHNARVEQNKRDAEQATMMEDVTYLDVPAEEEPPVGDYFQQHNAKVAKMQEAESKTGVSLKKEKAAGVSLTKEN